MTACPKCSFEVCQKCVIGFAKTLSGDITCMSCKDVWDRAFIFRELPLSIVYKELKIQREQMLFDTETALLPASSLILQNKKVRSGLQSQKAELMKQINAPKNKGPGKAVSPDYILVAGTVF